MRLNKMKGLFVPLITPFNNGAFDNESMQKLVQKLESYAEGFIPCLSTGEGKKISEEDRITIVKSVMDVTNKEIYAGILDKSNDEIIEITKQLKKIGCNGVCINVINGVDESTKSLFEKINMKVILYFTEPIDNDEVIQLLFTLKNLIAIKDSTRNLDFFNKILKAKSQLSSPVSIYQGMEDLLIESKDCDGYILALANLEPELCKKMYDNLSADNDKKIKSLFKKYNLGGDEWFLTLKSELTKRDIIKSGEPVIGK
jgi:4-hydroxy-tetrahydrodipicolinate synthase